MNSQSQSGYVDPKPTSDCRCPDFSTECCGGCQGEAGDCGCVEKDKWELIEEEHYPECPTAVKARQNLICTLCFCAEIEKADKMAREEEALDRRQEQSE